MKLIHVKNDVGILFLHDCKDYLTDDHRLFPPHVFSYTRKIIIPPIITIAPEASAYCNLEMGSL